MKRKEVQAVLGIDTAEFQRITDTGELAAIGSRVPETALEEYIARRLPEMAATP